MLVLTRKKGEKLMIGDNITVTVLNVKEGGRLVVLGIEAPKEIPIERENMRHGKRTEAVASGSSDEGQ